MAVLPREIRDEEAGIVAKSSGRVSVGRASVNRAVVISFDDIGVVVAISPEMARELADALKAQVHALSQ
jgi:hypothetical protein